MLIKISIELHVDPFRGDENIRCIWFEKKFENNSNITWSSDGGGYYYTDIGHADDNNNNIKLEWFCILDIEFINH